MRRVAPLLQRIVHWMARSVAVLAFAVPVTAQAYGPEGHLIAGRAAESRLCAPAAAEIRRLVPGQDLGELGLWADRIRSAARYTDSSPWHYLNIATGEPLAGFRHPPEGDVLWAIGHFSARLADTSLDDATRRDALRFLVHFIVDLHQPLHVGLVEDRGGNTIDLQFQGKTTNLHRFWDTHAIEQDGSGVTAYASTVAAQGDAVSNPVALDPVVWAEESLAMRAAVYDFGQAGREPSTAYLEFAARATRERLTLASLRLSGTLNALFCPRSSVR